MKIGCFTKYVTVIGCMLILCGCARTEEGGNALTSTPLPTVTSKSTAEPLPTTEPTVTPNPTQRPTPTPLPTGMPERGLVKYDSEAEQITIDENYFSDDVFRYYISEEFDTDKDCALSKSEREQVTSIDFDIENVTFDKRRSEQDPSVENSQIVVAWDTTEAVIDGLEWFPNLKNIRLVSGGKTELYLDHHSNVEEIAFDEAGWDNVFFIEGCEKLKSIYVGMSQNVAFYVKDCKNLEGIATDGAKLDFMYLSGTPKLNLCAYDFQINGPCYVDADAQVCLNGSSTRFFRGGTPFEVRKDGLPMFGGSITDTGERIPDTQKEKNITWLGIFPKELHLKAQKELISAKNEAYLPQEFQEGDKIQTLVKAIVFAPKKVSVYGVGSVPKGAHTWNSEIKSVHYYIIDARGTVFEYASVEELSVAAADFDNLKNLNFHDVVTFWEDYQ